MFLRMNNYIGLDWLENTWRVKKVTDTEANMISIYSLKRFFRYEKKGYCHLKVTGLFPCRLIYNYMIRQK